MDKSEREKLFNKEWRDNLHSDLQNRPGIISLSGNAVIAMIEHIDALEAILKNLAAPIYSDEKVYALSRYHQGDEWAVTQLHDFALRAKAAIASAQEGKS
jgi:hypothetical protein